MLFFNLVPAAVPIYGNHFTKYFSKLSPSSDVKASSSPKLFKESNNLNRALCMPDLTSIKDLYERFKECDLVGELDIVNVARLYKNSF